LQPWYDVVPAFQHSSIMFHAVPSCCCGSKYTWTDFANSCNSQPWICIRNHDRQMTRRLLMQNNSVISGRLLQMWIHFWILRPLLWVFVDAWMHFSGGLLEVPYMVCLQHSSS
jgi:hypothetical protein